MGVNKHDIVNCIVTTTVIIKLSETNINRTGYAGHTRTHAHNETNK